MQKRTRPQVNKQDFSVKGVLGLLAVAALSTLAYAIASRENFNLREINNSVEDTFN